MSEDTGNSAPSLTQALVPPEIEATESSQFDLLKG